MAIVELQNVGGTVAIPDDSLPIAALDLHHAVGCASTVRFPHQWRFPGGYKAVGPFGGIVQAQGFVAPQFSCACRQLVHVEIDSPVAILGKLQLVQKQGERVQKAGHKLHAHGCALEGLKICAACSGVRPHGRPQHLGHGFAGAAVHAP